MKELEALQPILGDSKKLKEVKEEEELEEEQEEEELKEKEEKEEKDEEEEDNMKEVPGWCSPASSTSSCTGCGRAVQPLRVGPRRGGGGGE